MAELIAQGPDASARWRRTLLEGVTVRLGRAPDNGWSVAWDSQISREHAELTWHDGRLGVRRLAGARNPIFVRGHATAEFTVAVGEHFVIGSTSFHVAVATADVSLDAPAPREQHTFRPGDLSQTRFRDSDHRLEVLAHLPELIAESPSEEVFLVRLVGLVLAGISHAEAAALVKRVPHSEGAGKGVDADGETARSDRQVVVLQWDRRRDAAGRFEPSQRLILEALARGESVLHVWTGQSVAESTFTVSENLDWAFCTPVPREACRDWGLYVAGTFSTVRASGDTASAPRAASAHDLKADLRFVELVAELVGALRQARELESRQAVLRQFFAPAVLETMSRGNAEESLAPREADVTVLFCDLRGFSREAEHWREQPKELLARVSDALSGMTRHIREHGGVIGDFQGDAAMGFWGWPLPTPDGPVAACRAALEICAEFERAATQPDHSLANFQVGIGIAHGRAVAGKIGTPDHVKVTVFGPVVNLASRLESMTKQFGVSVLLDERTGEYARVHMPRGKGRFRRLCRVRPYGLETPVMVYQLLPPATIDPTVSDQNLTEYAAALDALLAGRWSESLKLLHRLPANDHAKDFLTLFLTQHNGQPPPDWDGVITMPSK